MKLVLITALLSLCFSTSAFAQAGKKMTLPPTSTNTTSYPTYNGGTPQNEVIGNFGFVAGAITIGATYVRPNPDFGFGGYFLMQSAKEKNNVSVVTQVTAFGALIKVNLVDNNKIRAYMAPGFGIAMLKDASRNTTTGSKTDENLISPTFKIGVQYKFNPKVSVGLERMDFANWLNDSLNNFAGPTEYYTVAAAFDF